MTGRTLFTAADARDSGVVAGKTELPAAGDARQTERPSWQACELDIAGCERLEIVVTLYEHEIAGVRPESWPAAVRAKVDQQAEAWLAERPNRVARAITYGVSRRAKITCAVCIVHHAERA